MDTLAIAIKINHRTLYRYRQPVYLNPHALMLRPRESRDLRLILSSIAATPQAEMSWAHYMLLGNPETIYSFLKARSPEGVCDDCIARETGVAPRQQIALVTRSFGLTSDFDRSMGICFFCHGQKLVTRSLQDA